MTGSVTDLAPAMALLHEAGAAALVPEAQSALTDDVASQEAAARLTDLQPADSSPDPHEDGLPEFTDSPPVFDDAPDAEAAVEPAANPAPDDNAQLALPQVLENEDAQPPLRPFTPVVPRATVVPPIEPRPRQLVPAYGPALAQLAAAFAVLRSRRPRKRTFIAVGLVAVVVVVASLGDSPSPRPAIPAVKQAERAPRPAHPPNRDTIAAHGARRPSVRPPRRVAHRRAPRRPIVVRTVARPAPRPPVLAATRSAPTPSLNSAPSEFRP